MEMQENLQDIAFVLLYGSVIEVSVAGALYLRLRRGEGSHLMKQGRI